MAIRDRETAETGAFRKHLEAWVRRRFVDANPEYVDALATEMADEDIDLEKVIRECAPLIGEPIKFGRLLTSLVDVELWMDKCRQSVWYLSHDPKDSWIAFNEQGLGLEYHVDAWYFFVSGLLDRLRRLVTFTCRDVLRDSDRKDWKIVEAELLGAVDNMKKAIEKARNKIAHGGGSVEALAEEGLLEPYLVASGLAGPDDVIHLFGDDYGIDPDRRRKWREATAGYTEQMFNESAKLFQKLSDVAFVD